MDTQLFSNFCYCVYVVVVSLYVQYDLRVHISSYGPKMNCMHYDVMIVSFCRGLSNTKA